MSNNIVYWKMRNGVLISIDDMDVNHLRNTLKMIVNNSNKHKRIISLNGDMAQEFNNSFSDEDDEDHTEEINHYYLQD